MAIARSFAVDFLLLFGELLALFFVVAFAVALAARCVGVTRLRDWMGGGQFEGALKGIALGFVTPFCTYSAIPLLVGMLSAGVRTSAAAGFLMSAPLLDPLVFAAIAVLFSPETALAYAISAFSTVLVVAVLADAWRLERWVLLRPLRVAAGAPGGPEDATAGCIPCVDACADPFTDEGRWRGLRSESASAVRYARDLIRGMLRPLIVAVAIATLIVGIVPQDTLASVAGGGSPVAVPLAAAIGVPFYVSTAALIPIGAALLDQGMVMGAVFALVVAGAGVNLPEFALLSRILAPRLLAANIAAVFGVAVACGYLVPVLLRVGA